MNWRENETAQKYIFNLVLLESDPNKKKCTAKGGVGQRNLSLSHLHRLFFPFVKCHRPDLGDMYPQAAMNTRTLYTKGHTQIDARPVWPCG